MAPHRRFGGDGRKRILSNYRAAEGYDHPGRENIYPREIEELLYTHPKIQDVQITGVPDEKYGEQVAAFIRVQEGETLAPEEVRSFCEGKIARYKIPRYVFLVDEYPMTASGKIQKFRLREMAVRELGLDKKVEKSG